MSDLGGEIIPNVLVPTAARKARCPTLYVAGVRETFACFTPARIGGAMSETGKLPNTTSSKRLVPHGPLTLSTLDREEKFIFAAVARSDL
jgi:hypothetical protein